MNGTKRHDLPIRIENIQPILRVRDMSASRAFYVGILGFEEAPWGNDQFTSVSRDKCGIYLCQGGQGNEGTFRLYTGSSYPGV